MTKNFKNTIFVDNLFENIISAGPSLSINNCGYTYMPQGYTNPFVTLRSEGTDDYQLLYVERGNIHMEFEGKNFLLKDGELLLIPPRIYQKYYTVPNKEHKDFWIHFSGAQVPALLKKISVSPLQPVYLGENINLANDITNMALLMQIKQPGYEMKSLSIFYDIFYILYSDIVSARQSSNYFQIKAAIEFIHRHYSEIRTISELAEKCSLSVSRFQYLFKAEFGKSALKYITELKIAQAKRLLVQTDYSIREIAEILGFEDALYFSKVFKHYTGTAPKYFKWKDGKNEKSPAD